MKVVAFNGSPRLQGNTEFLLRKALEPIAAAGIETEFMQVGGKNIRGCTACYKCRELKNQRCAITNDILNDCVEKMISADGILIGTPTYFANVSTEIKALIDRCGIVCRANGDLLRRKVGAGVVAVRRGGAVAALDAINHFFLINSVIVPGSTYFNFGLGRNKGEAEQDEEGVANMIDLGNTMIWLLNKIRN